MVGRYSPWPSRGLAGPSTARGTCSLSRGAVVEAGVVVEVREQLRDPAERDVAELRADHDQLGARLELEAALQLGQDLLPAPTSGADQEDPAEPLLVGHVALDQRPREPLVGRGAGLL